MENFAAIDNLNRLRSMSKSKAGTSGFSTLDLLALKMAVDICELHLTKKETREVTVEFLKQILEEMESNWHCIDSEWGPAKGGLEQEIADGHEPVIKELRKIISGENHV